MGRISSGSISLVNANRSKSVLSIPLLDTLCGLNGSLEGVQEGMVWVEGWKFDQ